MRKSSDMASKGKAMSGVLALRPCQRDVLQNTVNCKKSEKASISLAPALFISSSHSQPRLNHGGKFANQKLGNLGSLAIKLVHYGKILLAPLNSTVFRKCKDAQATKSL